MRPVLYFALVVAALVAGLLSSGSPAAAQPGFPNNPYCDGLYWYEIQAFDHHHAYPEEDLAFWGCQAEPSATPGPVGNVQLFNNTWWEIWRPEWGTAPSGMYLPPAYDASWMWQWGADWSGGSRESLEAFDAYGIPLYSPANGVVVDGQLPLISDIGECQTAVRARKQPRAIYSLIIDYNSWYLYIGGLGSYKVNIGDKVAIGQEIGRSLAGGWGQTGFFFAAMKDGTGFIYDVFDPYGWNQDLLGLKDEPLFPGFDHHYTACDIQSRRVISPMRKGSGPCFGAGGGNCPDEPIIIDNESQNTRDFGIVRAECTNPNEPAVPAECEPLTCNTSNPIYHGFHGVYEVGSEGSYAYEHDYHWSVSWQPEDGGAGEFPARNIDYAYWACWDCDTSKPVSIAVSTVGIMNAGAGPEWRRDRYNQCFKEYLESEAMRISGSEWDWPWPMQAPYQTYQVYGFKSGRPPGDNPSPGFLGKAFRLVDQVTIETGGPLGAWVALGDYMFAPGETPVVVSTNIVGLSANGKADGIPFNYMCNPWLTNLAVFDAVKFTPICTEPEIVRDPNEPVPVVTDPPWRWRLPTATPVINPEPTLGSRTWKGGLRWAAQSTPTP